MASKKRLQFSTIIEAPASHVYERMIDPESYQDWTSAFAEGSRFDGSWDQGERIRFVGPSGDGIVSEIAENRPNEFISIRHLGFILKGIDDTQSEAVRAWVPAYENYTFQAVPEGTRLLIELDVTEDFEREMKESWPKALTRLKTLCEGSAQSSRN